MSDEQSGRRLFPGALDPGDLVTTTEPNGTRTETVEQFFKRQAEEQRVRDNAPRTSGEFVERILIPALYPDEPRFAPNPWGLTGYSTCSRGSDGLHGSYATFHVGEATDGVEFMVTVTEVRPRTAET